MYAPHPPVPRRQPARLLATVAAQQCDHQPVPPPMDDLPMTAGVLPAAQGRQSISMSAPSSTRPVCTGRPARTRRAGEPSPDYRRRRSAHPRVPRPAMPGRLGKDRKAQESPRVPRRPHGPRRRAHPALVGAADRGRVGAPATAGQPLRRRVRRRSRPRAQPDAARARDPVEGRRRDRPAVRLGRGPLGPPELGQRRLRPPARPRRRRDLRVLGGAVARGVPGERAAGR